MNLFSQLVARLAAGVAAFLADLRGVSTVEYALMIVAVIAAVGVAAVLLGDAFEDIFNQLGTELSAGVTNVKKNVVT